jgi:hypothetical protein
MWIYNGEEITSIDQMPEGAIGFVYNIVTNEGREYIGKKNLYSKRKRKFGKKEIAKITDKRKKHWEYVTKESDWKTYNSSNKELKEDIKNGVEVTKYILQFAFEKKELSYLEEKHLWCCGVLEHGDKYYNSNIAGRYYKKG